MAVFRVKKTGELRWYSYGGANGTCEIEKKYLARTRSFIAIYYDIC